MSRPPVIRVVRQPHRRPRRYSLCETTGKVRYRDHRTASDALVRARRSPSVRRQEARAYRCKHCRGWHLTSMA